jgi:hypothetical protein
LERKQRFLKKARKNFLIPWRDSKSLILLMAIHAL